MPEHDIDNLENKEINDEYKVDEHFRTVVIQDFKTMDVKSLKQLAFLMRGKNYHVIGKYPKMRAEYPTEPQLKNAWDILKKQGVVDENYDEYRSIENIKDRKKRIVRDKKTGRILKWIW